MFYNQFHPSQKIPYLTPDNIRSRGSTCLEVGGVGLNDLSQGMEYQVWKLEVIGNTQVVLSNTSGYSELLFIDSNIKSVGLAFTQNMQKVICIEHLDHSVDLYWFDTSVGAEVKTTYPGIRTARLTLDDKRVSQLINSDVVFAYIRNVDNALCYRLQRERFEVEHVIGVFSARTKLRNIGMNEHFRVQFELQYP